MLGKKVLKLYTINLVKVVLRILHVIYWNVLVVKVKLYIIIKYIIKDVKNILVININVLGYLTIFKGTIAPNNIIMK